ncbi:MAG TPA: hypothetical protein VNZ53_41245, partial [Steroidobacteraceae bacterium]|nr:hypothetical protein [Steroidobacteraceae bacterium]
RVTAAMAQDVLTLRVLNTIAPEKSVGDTGIGLNNVRERLAVQFEGRAGLAAGRTDTQWCSEITMPAIRQSPPRETQRAMALVSA